MYVCMYVITHLITDTSIPETVFCILYFPFYRVPSAYTCNVYFSVFLLQSSSSSKLSAQRLHSAHGIQPLINNTKKVRKVRPRLKHQKKKYPYCLREKQKVKKWETKYTRVSCAHINIPVQKHTSIVCGIPNQSTQAINHLTNLTKACWGNHLFGQNSFQRHQ